ncbi:hypothetical protein C5Y97_16320 [Blastopirellula marina]|uniref:Uncharacterized protein n=1 Tax=Blastopirellula marina TaxID=124 RepID=A0A2S8FNL8_9BACT|nr:hypothetical protein C5Y98_16310 [Blastopirellula marina]PTL43579.1 hypothetical protein C5Y97_16320 [Blastopirellula marina]
MNSGITTSIIAACEQTISLPAPASGVVAAFFNIQTRKISFARTDDSGDYQWQVHCQARGSTKGTDVVEVSITKQVAGLDGGEEKDKKKNTARIQSL